MGPKHDVNRVLARQLTTHAVRRIVPPLVRLLAARTLSGAAATRLLLVHETLAIQV